jgi:hypothetical protein
MNRYILIRRLRGPAYLLLVGVMALLAQAHILSWGKSWPLYLILGGVLLLAERAALAGEHYPPPPYPGAPYQGQPYPGTPYPGTVNPNAPQPSAQPGTDLVPSPRNDFENGNKGGQQ